MDNISDEYKYYWETNMFLQTEELDISYFDDPISGYSDSSSPDGGHDASSSASKNIMSERNRRKKLNDRLYALRAVVPNITKMDKASIVKDAVEYIQSLHDEEQRIQAEIAELETGCRPGGGGFDFDHQDEVTGLLCSPIQPESRPLSRSPIQLLELGVSYMRENTLVVSLRCSKGADTIVRLCEIFESLNLNIITANITAFSGTLLKTVFLQGDEEEKEVLRFKIHAAIAALNDPDSPMSA